MRFYSDIPARRTAAILSDLLVLLLLLLFAWLGLRVHDAVAEIASVPRGVSNTGGAIQRGFESAGEAVGGEVAETGREGEEDVNNLANVLGALFFLLPAAAVLSRYLPDRIADVRRLRAAARAIGPTLTPDRERTLAMRAAYGLPYERLVRYTRDPLADLENGRYDGLVAAELDDAGLRPSRSR